MRDKTPFHEARMFVTLCDKTHTQQREVVLGIYIHVPIFCQIPEYSFIFFLITLVSDSFFLTFLLLLSLCEDLSRLMGVQITLEPEFPCLPKVQYSCPPPVQL